MSAVPYLAFAALALLALGFIALPLRRAAMPPRKRWLVGGAIALVMLAVAAGAYLKLGQPRLALRSDKPDHTDVNGLIGMLIDRVKKTPGDYVAWTYLGRGYLAARDPADAAKAFARAIDAQRAQGPVDAGLYSAYGEAIVETADGAVPPEAERAFTAALAANPKDMASRFFMGQARAMKGDREGARQLWMALLAEVPTDSPLHQLLVDRVAMLTSAAGGAPDISAMVAGLAARLKADPHDAAGWQRLIRAYSVLGDTDKAKDALATARTTFAGDAAVLSQINDEAAELKLN